MRRVPIEIAAVIGLGLAVCSLWRDAAVVHAQEQVDRAERVPRRVEGCCGHRHAGPCDPVYPGADAVVIHWRRGGEGLGGTVIHGELAPDSTKDAGPAFSIGQWCRWTPLETVVGRTRRWEFPTITVEYLVGKGQRKDPPCEIAVDFEFAVGGKVFKQLTETAPRGATVGLSFPGQYLAEKGSGEAAFAAGLQGLSGHARARRERLEEALGKPLPPPKHLAVLGHLAGYGEGPGAGRGKAVGYGVRHCNPEIVADECRTLQLLGVNALVGANSLSLADAAGLGSSFRLLYWGGPGSGSPMNFLTKGGKEADACPFDPRLKAAMADAVQQAIAEHRAARARRSWGIWWDEVGVAAKEHIIECPRCAEQFRVYLRRQQIEPAALGKASWAEVTPYPLWIAANPAGGKPKQSPAPQAGPEALRYYYTWLS